MNAQSMDRLAVLPGHGATPSGLSSAFGTSAVSTLHGGRTRRQQRRRGDRPIPPPLEPAASRSDPLEQMSEEDDVQDSGEREASRTARPARATTGSRDAKPARRPFRTVRVRDRQDIDVLLLAVASERPTGGRAFIDLVRERSGGILVLTEGTVYHELRRLRINRLIRLTDRGGVRRFLLTDLGERVLATRRRQWEAFSAGFDAVLRGADRD